MTGFSASWFLDKVKVKNERTGKEWNFPCGRWLSKELDDKQTTRDLVSGDSSSGYSRKLNEQNLQ
jgi:hypothetical protein